MLLCEYKAGEILLGDRLAVDDPDQRRTYVLMIIEGFSKEFPICVIIAAGRKAGRILCALPRESLLSGTVMVSRAWLIQNWDNRIGIGDVAAVRFLGRYEISENVIMI